MIKGISIKALARSHLPAIETLLQDYFHMGARESYPRELIREFIARYCGAMLEKMILSSETIALGAFQENELIGCGWGYLSHPDGVFSIDWSVVRPDVIGTGIFSQIMKVLEAEAEKRGAWKIFLYTSIKNRAAVNRYQKLGFTVEGVHPNHYFGWDFISMGKVLIRRKWDGPIMEQPDAA